MKNYSRRDFLKAAAVGTTGALSLGLMGSAAAAEVGSFADSIAWDGAYDVVVAGYGFAGAAAAITAYEEGAKVLLTEKAPQGEEGGNSKYSGQVIMATRDPETLAKYLRNITGLFADALPDDMIEAFCREANETHDWLLFLGAKEEDMSKFSRNNATNEWGGTYWNWWEYPELEGGEAVQSYLVSGQWFDGSFYRLLQDNVKARAEGIDLWYSAPAEHLIQDPDTKAVIGVQIRKEGVLQNIRAKNGVVLCTGGFENSSEMLSNYLQQPYAYAYGAALNTGDGIRMAQELGAQLWHMGNCAGYLFGFKAPENTRGLYSRSVYNKGIFIGLDSKRFMDESLANRHGRISIGGRWISTPMPLPTYFITDDAVIKSGPLYSIFSEDNSEEVEKGWLIKADTIEALAEKIGRSPEVLKATIQRWNEDYDRGEDTLYARAFENMVPLKTPPYYAMEFGPMMFNTQGGPRRNPDANIVDMAGNPIPHLYSAGELGAMWPDMYNGSGNIGECCAFGRIAGRNAAAPKA